MSKIKYDGIDQYGVQALIIGRLILRQSQKVWDWKWKGSPRNFILVCRYTFSISTSSSYIKVIGSKVKVTGTQTSHSREWFSFDWDI